MLISLIPVRGITGNSVDDALPFVIHSLTVSNFIIKMPFPFSLFNKDALQPEQAVNMIPVEKLEINTCKILRYSYISYQLSCINQVVVVFTNRYFGSSLMLSFKPCRHPHDLYKQLNVLVYTYVETLAQWHQNLISPINQISVMYHSDLPHHSISSMELRYHILLEVLAVYQFTVREDIHTSYHAMDPSEAFSPYRDMSFSVDIRSKREKNTQEKTHCFDIWRARRDSNSRPPGSKPDTLSN